MSQQTNVQEGYGIKKETKANNKHNKINLCVCSTKIDLRCFASEYTTVELRRFAVYLICSNNRQQQSGSDPNGAKRNNYEAAESSGVYWISKSFRGKKNLNRVCDLENSISVHNVAFVCWCVNGGDNGHSERQGFVRFLANILLDDPYKTVPSEQFQILVADTAGTSFPPNSNAGLSNTMNAKAYYEFQRP